MAETTKKNLYQKLLLITEEVGKIEKTGRNSQQGYAFTEYATVAAEVRVQLAKHGVMIVPETTGRTIESFTNKNGTTMFHANVQSRYTLVNADDPKEIMVCEWDGGESLDTSDKASNKAITASAKSFYMKLFNISDKDDPDAGSPIVEQSPFPEDLPVKQVEKVSVGETPISEVSKTKVRQALHAAGITGESATAHLMNVIGKPVPTTEEDAEDILSQLSYESWVRDMPAIKKWEME